VVNAKPNAAMGISEAEWKELGNRIAQSPYKYQILKCDLNTKR
jgi:hypothetical protein